MDNLKTIDQPPIKKIHIQNIINKRLVGDVILILILLLGIYFRFTGLNWDQNHHLHPDERFLTMVETGITPVDNLREYFNTETSTLNPHNAGFGFYVYGTLPIFIVRYLAEWTSKTGYDQVHLVGRAVSASFDILAVLLVYLITRRLFRKDNMALLAAAFSAMSVLNIQLSHYFTVDVFTNFCAFLTFYFAVCILTENKNKADDIENSSAIEEHNVINISWLKRDWSSSVYYVLFGISLGMAVASKVSIGLIAVLLPIVSIIKYSKLHHHQRDTGLLILLRNLILAAIISFLIFRIFQPYAFAGPGFLGLQINPKWIDNLRDLSAQSNGDVDFPPALQWARLPFGFAWSNMVLFGMGIPLGILAWVGFIWMGWAILKGEWRQNIVVWGWTLLYFIWQSSVFNPTMRYLLPVYPTLSIIAAWTLIRLWDRNKFFPFRIKNLKYQFSAEKLLSVLIGIIVLSITFLWAYAFSRIYTRPVTRVEASEWIYQNIPGAINIRIESEDGIYNQPLSFRWGEKALFEDPIIIGFKPTSSGFVKGISFSHIYSPEGSSEGLELSVQISGTIDSNLIASGSLNADFNNNDGDPRGKAYTISFEPSTYFENGKEYFIKIKPSKPEMEMDLSGVMTLEMETDGGNISLPLPDPVEVIRNGNSYTTQFTAQRTGEVNQIYLPRIADSLRSPGSKTVKLQILEPGASNKTLGSAILTDTFIARNDPRGQEYTLNMDKPVQLIEGKEYLLLLDMPSGGGAIGIYGSRQANESTWDDPLPVSLEGYNPFDYFSGLYRSDLNFEMYWDDNDIKRDRFISILNQADYIFISSNRQWGSTTRVPERYPLTSLYYRKLLGCPDNREINWCYKVADVGTFSGELGFDLIKISQSDPNIGPIKINTQFAEEAFTVYDHPKVLIFKKNTNYKPSKIFSIFNSFDLSSVIHITPRKTKSFPANLMLPLDRLSTQREGGTWSELFDRTFLPNQNNFFAAIYWYLAISLIGWINFPITRFVFYGLSDKGYPLVRIIGISLVAYFSWLASSNGVLFTKLSISITILTLILINSIFFYIQHKSISKELRIKWRYFLTIEIISAVLFTIFLLIRVGNPDLWHPYKGGEKPMDFSYLNAVIKSSTFPPYDPWFAGGYINYYYYGFVLAGVIVKWLGIIPSIAYNLILSSFFSFLGISAFSAGWNLINGPKNENEIIYETPVRGKWIQIPFWGGLFSTIFLLILGNLGSLRMIWYGLIKLSTSINVTDLYFYEKWYHSIIGFWSFLGGMALPYSRGDWYWIPSRVISGEPITEFPLFTFLYGDPHAHLFALPITLTALSWSLSILFQRWNWGVENNKKFKWTQFFTTFLLGGLIIGSLRTINTWDTPTYLAIAVTAVIYSSMAHSQNTRLIDFHSSNKFTKVLEAILCSGLLIFLSFKLFFPFSRWFGQAYNTIGLWKGDHTPMGSYFTHWGLFLFVIISWILFETIDWMARTPLASLVKIKPYINILKFLVVLLVCLSLGFLIFKVAVGIFIPILCIWILIILLRPGQSLAKRAVLFMTGTALVLSLAVELVVIQGDIGRMNTVFKFYLQAWNLLSISAAASLVWLIPEIMKMTKKPWANLWIASLVILLGSAALFPLLGTIDKIRDRMSDSAPHTLDGMEYMATSQYSDFGVTMELKEDYGAIQWMQDNIKGSPVIVEANTPEYRWGSRFSIYTGLPGVVGWNWHQRQQRAISPTEWVWNRVENVNNFYQTVDRRQVTDFLQKYDVSYIVVGQLEIAANPGPGIDKFETWNGDLWNLIYQEGHTSIYQVKK